MVNIFWGRLFAPHEVVEWLFAPEQVVHVPRHTPLAPAHQVVKWFLAPHQVVSEAGGRLFASQKVIHLGTATAECKKVTPGKDGAKLDYRALENTHRLAWTVAGLLSDRLRYTMNIAKACSKSVWVQNPLKENYKLLRSLIWMPIELSDMTFSFIVVKLFLICRLAIYLNIRLSRI